MLNERKEHLIAQKVEVALVFQQMLGSAEAHAYLAGNGIAEDVIARVLYHPESRRSYASTQLGASVSAAATA